MENQSNNIDKLNQKLDELINRQNSLQNEISNLQREIAQIGGNKPAAKANVQMEPVEVPPVQKSPEPRQKPKKPSRIKKDFEKFIGENLISKIGIAILVIGVGIGAKYAIENELFNPSPAMRIISGYLAGIVLLVFALRLKRNYEKFSAVLLSGAMAILYFITFAAYSFYDLLPISITFTLMVLFTVFTVVAAIKYDQEVISIIGLVGAYAVPFLLSSGEGRVEILFSYILIINIGVLFVAIKRYWKKLYFSSFFLTWIIYSSWFLFEYDDSTHFGLSLIFASAYFIVFYAAFLSNKLLQKEAFNRSDIVLLFLNSFLFFGFGYAILSSKTQMYDYLGLFTLGNAITHFAVSLIVFKNKFHGKNLFYFIGALVLVFLTITFPVQFDGNWVTLFWVVEAILLFWIGRAKHLPIYEKLSYPLIILGFLSQIHDWLDPVYYSPYQSDFSFTPILNIDFIAALIFCIALALINYINHKQPAITDQFKRKWLFNLMQIVIPGILLLALFTTGFLEIERYWEVRYNQSEIPFDETYEYQYRYNPVLRLFGSVWQVVFTLIFAASLVVFNLRILKNKNLAALSVIINLVAILLFLTNGLFTLSEIRDYYFTDELQKHFSIGNMALIIRYITYIFLALSLYFTWQNISRLFDNPGLKMGFQMITHLAIVWTLSSELIHWMDIYGSPNYKLGLSILWGVYALFMIVIGISQKQKHIRIGAFVLFGITLLKLFFYDMQALDTISKTIVFISLGVLLLIISFLYNKYKTAIFDNEKS